MFDEGVMQKLLATMNQHLPAQRRPLSELLLEKEPHYLGKDGHRYRLDRKELDHIAILLDPFDKARLRLPILIMTDTTYESGGWRVAGKVEAKLVSKVLGREMDSEEEIRFFFPHLHELRKQLPTSTTVMYMP
jgi:uncharacterized protein (UPF0216 family)